MKQVRTIILSLFVMSLVVLSTGCGAGKTTSESTSPAASEAAAATTAATPEATAEAKPVTLRLLSWWPQEQMQETLDAFAKANPNVKIDFQFSPTGDPYVSLLKTQLTAGDAPDVFLIGGEWKDFVKPGYVMDITGQPFVSKFADNALQQTNLGGKQYGIPVDSWFSGIFVNKDLADKAGVKLPFNSLDEFIAAADAFKKIGVKPLGVAGGAKTKDVWRFAYSEVFADLYNQNPNFDNDINAGKTTFTEGWTPALKKWYTLIEKGIYTKDMLGMDQAQLDAEFTTGKVAMTYGGTWSVDGWKKANPDIHLSMIPWAGSTSGSVALMGGVGMNWSINEASKNKEAALKWLEFMATPEGLLPLQKKIGSGIFLKDAKYELFPEVNDSLATLGQGKAYNPWSFWDNGTAINNTAIDKLQEVLAGTAKIEDVGTAMDKAKASAGN